MAQNNFYYIGVMDNEVGMKFVTSIDKQSKMALWDKDKKPLAMTQQTAKDYAEALAANLVPATVVRTFWELDNQPCWVMTEDEKNIDKLSSLVADVIKDVDKDVELNVANKWENDGLKGYYNTDTEVISVYQQNVFLESILKDKNAVVLLEPVEYNEFEVTLYCIYPTQQMKTLFNDTEENRELLVKQLETKTGKSFVFAEPDQRENVNVRLPYIENDNDMDEQRNRELLELEPSDTPDYYERLDGESEELNLTAGNNRGR